MIRDVYLDPGSRVQKLDGSRIRNTASIPVPGCCGARLGGIQEDVLQAWQQLIHLELQVSTVRVPHFIYNGKKSDKISTHHSNHEETLYQCCGSNPQDVYVFGPPGSGCGSFHYKAKK
jgi:hypothetical protein